MSGSAADLTLAIDTATADTVAGIGRGAELLGERRISPAADGMPRHGPALLVAVQEVVDGAGGWDRVERIAVGIGPGSFTGIRIGVATARALAQARALPIAGVETTATLAAGIPAEPGRARLAVVDARRGEVFVALLHPAEPIAGAPLVLAPEAVAATSQGARGSLAAGDGAVRFRNELEAAGIGVLADEHPAHRLSARHVCAISDSVAAGPPEDVRPLYLRRPDAERWRERDGRN